MWAGNSAAFVATSGKPQTKNELLKKQNSISVQTPSGGQTQAPGREQSITVARNVRPFICPASQLYSSGGRHPSTASKQRQGECLWSKVQGSTRSTSNFGFSLTPVFRFTGVASCSCVASSSRAKGRRQQPEL